MEELKNFKINIIGAKEPQLYPCYEIGEILVVDFGEQSATFEDKPYPRYGHWIKSRLQHPYTIFNLCLSATIELMRRKEESLDFAWRLNEADYKEVLIKLRDPNYKPSFEEGIYLRNIGLEIEADLLGAELPDWHKHGNKKPFVGVVINTPGGIEDDILDWLLG